MSASKNIFLTIGKSTYNIATPLDDEALERVKGLIDQACGSPVKGMGQEYLLVLTCLQLAYALDRATTSLANLVDRLDQATREEDVRDNDE